MDQDEQIECMRWLNQIVFPWIPDGNSAKILESMEGGDESVLRYGRDIAFENERKEGREEE